MPSNKTYDQMDDLYKFSYNIITQKHREEGQDISWEEDGGVYIKIKNMDDEYLNDTINMLKGKPPNGYHEAWIDILEDVRIKRRFMKIEKIKNNID